MRELEDGVWELDKREGMLVPAKILGTKKLVAGVEDGALKQCQNVAFLPGIVKHSIAMPDIHWGYGFPIGGVAATRISDGVVSPGGVGFDINCGVRMLRTDLNVKEVKPKLKQLMDSLFNHVPAGLGGKSKLRLSESELGKAVSIGAKWAVENDLGWESDLERTEDNGCVPGADFEAVSDRARKRGRPQFGTLGSGNHFLEVQVVDEIFDEKIANTFGIFDPGQVTVMIHCGSRGFGHQIASDYIKVMEKYVRDNKIDLPDKQLACAHVSSKEAQDYFKAMNCAVNYAFNNRQVIAAWTREAFSEVFGKSAEDLGMTQVYDVCHNIAKFETHVVDGKEEKLCVHRKGATRAFPAGRPELPNVYKSTGHPVIIPGTMGTSSYLLVGTQRGLDLSFGSTCHGAGRVMSRHAALKKYHVETLLKDLESKGEVIRAASKRGLTEEAPGAYKDVDEVIRSVELAGVSRKVARVKPLGVVKG